MNKSTSLQIECSFEYSWDVGRRMRNRCESTMDKIGKFIYLIERAEFTETRARQQIKTGESPSLEMENKPRKHMHS